MSTIITTNPYTFTVEDNMNIKAVFENSTGSLTGVSSSGAYATVSSGTCYVYFNNSQIATAQSMGYGFTVSTTGSFPKTFTGSASVAIDCSNMSTSFFNSYKIQVMWGGVVKTTITGRQYASITLDVRTSALVLNIVNK